MRYPVLPLVNEKPQTVVIQIGSNDINKFNYHDVDVNGLVRNHNNLNILIQGVNISLKHLCKVYGFDFIYNDRIG